MGSLQDPAAGAPRATLCHPVPPPPAGIPHTRNRGWAHPAAEQRLPEDATATSSLEQKCSRKT